jgi:ubiquinone/menaquinone biosynthesis C-methylase UbiE
MSKGPGWQLSGSAPEAYERFWIPALMGQCARDLVADGGVKEGDKVLDVGCGTGVVVREAARLVGPSGRVVGSDLNEGMLETAKRFAERENLREIEWQQCDAVTMPFDDGSFDVVLCQQGLQFMPDRQAAVKEMARVLAPGGRLALSVWKSASPLSIALCPALDHQFGVGTTAPWEAAFSLGDRDTLRSLVSEAGLRNAHVRLDIKIARHPSPNDFVAGVIAASPLADKVAALDDDDRTKLIGEIVGAMSAWMDDGGLVYPGECHTVIARK